MLYAVCRVLCAVCWVLWVPIQVYFGTTASKHISQQDAGKACVCWKVAMSADVYGAEHMQLGGCDIVMIMIIVIAVVI